MVYSNAARQGIPGSPSAESVRFYLVIPITMAFIGATLTIIAPKLPRVVFYALSVLLLVLIFPYLFLYTGGM
jgi:hypothetical protein